MVTLTGSQWTLADAGLDELAAIEAVKRNRTNLQTNRDGTVRLVRFSRDAVTDDMIAPIREFKNIDYLAIVCPQVTDTGIANIAGLTNLDTLLLSQTKVTDAGLSNLKDLSRLERLYLDETGITDAGLTYLKPLSALRILSLRKTKITDAGLVQLSGLKTLETLFLCDTAITDDGLRHLAGLENLKTLYLVRTKVAGESLSALAGVKSLTRISLSGTAVTAESLKHFAGCESLKDVLLYATTVTRANVSDLKLAMPKTNWHMDQPQYSGKTALDAALPTASNPRTEVAGENIQEPAADRFASSDTGEVPDFQRHVTPLLGRLGCNSRACHGSFQGKGGFRLSMFGYDFEMDLENLAKGEQPRVNTQSPDDSLILNKPTSEDDHEGGQRFQKNGWEYLLLRSWIAAGAKGRVEDPAEFVRLEITPPEIVFKTEGEEVQLTATAIWPDGSREDVTCLTRFESNDDGVAEVTPGGLVRAAGKGDTHIISFYDNGITPTPIMMPVSDRTNDNFPDVPTPTKIDELVVEKLSKLGIVPSNLSTDNEFLRRVSLDIIGTLPTPKEIEEFVADIAPGKRAKKIDELLERPAYVEWWSTRLCDLTGSNAGHLGNTDMAQPAASLWRKWLRRRVEDNIGWDEIAKGILLAKSRKPGETYEAFIARHSRYTAREEQADYSALDNSMPMYWFRDNIRLPEEKALAFGYSFLGIRLQCAQCHKHPFDQWSKQEFEQFREFFTRIATGHQPDALEPHDRLREMLGVPVKLNSAALRRQSYLRIAAEGRPIPWKEVYITPRDEEPQIGKLLGSAELDLSAFDDPREPLVQWLLDKNNHYFARSFVNRIWANYFNVGIINPPDDLNLANPPSNAPLLDWLSDQFIANGYDMKWLHRTITNSRTYQLTWRPNDTNRNDQHNFSHAIVRRLPAEVAIDAMIQSTANEAKLALSTANLTGRKIGQHPKSYQARAIDFSLLIFGKPLRTTNCDCERSLNPTLLQALYTRNDSELLSSLQRPDGWLVQLSRELRQPLKSEVTGQKDLVQKPNPDESPADQTVIDELIQTAYLRTVSRHPRADELAACRKQVVNAENTVEALRDVMWALLNTREFITNH